MGMNFGVGLSVHSVIFCLFVVNFKVPGSGEICSSVGDFWIFRGTFYMLYFIRKIWREI